MKKLCIHDFFMGSLFYFGDLLMSDEEINQFSTNLREVMLYLKYSKDKIRFYQYNNL